MVLRRSSSVPDRLQPESPGWVWRFHSRENQRLPIRGRQPRWTRREELQSLHGWARRCSKELELWLTYNKPFCPAGTDVKCFSLACPFRSGVDRELRPSKAKGCREVGWNSGWNEVAETHQDAGPRARASRPRPAGVAAARKSGCCGQRKNGAKSKWMPAVQRTVPCWLMKKTTPTLHWSALRSVTLQPRFVPVERPKICFWRDFALNSAIFTVLYYLKNAYFLSSYDVHLKGRGHGKSETVTRRHRTSFSPHLGHGNLSVRNTWILETMNFLFYARLSLPRYGSVKQRCNGFELCSSGLRLCFSRTCKKFSSTPSGCIPTSTAGESTTSSQNAVQTVRCIPTSTAGESTTSSQNPVQTVRDVIEQAQKEFGRKKKVSGQVLRSMKQSIVNQYDDLQEQHPDCVLLLEVGDFFEVIGPNARLVSQKMGLRLSRGRYSGSRDTAGFPVESAENWIKTMVEAGCNVAVGLQKRSANG